MIRERDLPPDVLREILARAEPAKVELRSKYRAVRTTVDGVTFASKREAKRYSELKVLLHAGEINTLELQPRYQIVVNGVKVCDYVADVRYRLQCGKVVVEDAKGVRTPAYRLKKKLMLAVHGICIVEV